MQILILAEGLKIEFLALSGKESTNFGESCEQLDIYTLPSIHMTGRFVIQGCPTLIGKAFYFSEKTHHTLVMYHYSSPAQQA